MSLLLLGGTADARAIAQTLIGRGVAIVYSIAGLVRMPNLDCEVISGGFSRFDDLQGYINARKISAVLDVTHPYARRISAAAVAAADARAIPYWRFQRPDWTPRPGDDWRPFSDWRVLLPALTGKRSVFFTVGQLPPIAVAALSRLPAGQRQLLRTAVRPGFELPATMGWQKAIGPFAKADELRLMRANGVDVLVSKNSGGEATAAKLHAARELKIPVFMLQRPVPPAPEKQFSDLCACEAAVLQWLGLSNAKPMQTTFQTSEDGYRGSNND